MVAVRMLVSVDKPWTVTLPRWSKKYERNIKVSSRCNVFQCPYYKLPTKSNINQYLYQCKKFFALDIEAKNKTVCRLQLCINCLKGGHNVSICKTTLRSQAGKGKLNTILHVPSTGWVTTLFTHPSGEQGKATVLNTAT